MKYISTFSGIGGFEFAIHQVFPDAECMGFSEIDPYAIKCYSAHYPNHKNLGSITDIDIENLPDFDLLVGGSPCQDLSVAKKNREGLKGDRSKLFFKYLEILRVKKPKYFILENVNSMTQENKDAITAYINQAEMRRTGKWRHISPIMIDAALVSAQSRRRLFWCNFPVTYPKDRKIFLKDILEPEVDEKYFIKNPKVLEKIAYLKSKKEVQMMHGKVHKEGAMPLTQNNKGKSLPLLASGQGISRTTSYIQLDISGKGHNSQQDGIYPLESKSPTLSKSSRGDKILLPNKPVKICNVNPSGNGINGNLYSDEGKSPTLTTNKGEGNKIVTGCALRSYPRQAKEEDREKRVEDRLDGKANCLTSVTTDSLVKHSTLTQAQGRAGSSREIIHSVKHIDDSGFGVRCLTPTECARLQNFPDKWVEMLSDSRQYMAYGNAVNTEVIKHICECLKQFNQNL